MQTRDITQTHSETPVSHLFMWLIALSTHRESAWVLVLAPESSETHLRGNARFVGISSFLLRVHESVKIPVEAGAGALAPHARARKSSENGQHSGMGID